MTLALRLEYSKLGGLFGDGRKSGICFRFRATEKFQLSKQRKGGTRFKCESFAQRQIGCYDQNQSTDLETTKAKLNECECETGHSKAKGNILSYSLWSSTNKLSNEVTYHNRLCILLLWTVRENIWRHQLRHGFIRCAVSSRRIEKPKESAKP